MPVPRSGHTEGGAGADLQAFVIQLGAALNAAGEPCYSVQDRLTEVARAYGASSVRGSERRRYVIKLPSISSASGGLVRARCCAEARVL